MDKSDKKEMKTMGAKKFVAQEKAEAKEAVKGYPAKGKKGGKKKGGK